MTLKLNTEPILYFSTGIGNSIRRRIASVNAADSFEWLEDKNYMLNLSPASPMQVFGGVMRKR